MGEEEQVFCVGDGTDMFMAGFSVMSKGSIPKKNLTNCGKSP